MVTGRGKSKSAAARTGKSPARRTVQRRSRKYFRPARGSLRGHAGEADSQPEDNLRCFYEVVPDGSTRGSLSDTKLRLVRRILFLGRRWRNLMDEALRASGGNHARWVTLLWVDMMAGRANLGELAEQIAVELPTLVRLLNRLEREGLVKRRALGGSNREKAVVLTAKGRRALIPMSDVINRTRARFVEEVDPQQLTAALKLLDGLLAKYANVVRWPGKPRA